MSTLKIEHIANIANSGPDVSIDTNGHLNIVNGSLQMGGTTMLDTSDTTLKNVSKIGIGTTSPTSMIQANQSDSTASQIHFTNSTTGTAISDGLLIGINSNEEATMWNRENTSTTFATNNTERMRIHSSGSLTLGSITPGIGDTAGTELTISDSTEAGITIRSGTSNHGNIYFSDATSGAGEYVGIIRYNHGSNYMMFQTNDSERMRIDSSGNMGLGTNDPVDIGGNFNTFNINGTKGGVLSFSRGTNSATQQYNIYTTDDDGLHIYRGGFSNLVMQMDSSGNVGIGATPARKFDVEGSANDDWISRIYNTNSNGSGTLIRTDATSANDKIALGVYADGAYKMVVRSTGNVGIGTTSPNAPLNIVHPALGAEPFCGLRINNTSGSGYYYTGVEVNAVGQSHYRYSLAGSLKWQTRVGAGNGTDQFNIYSWTHGDDVLNIQNNGRMHAKSLSISSNVNSPVTGNLYSSGDGIIISAGIQAGFSGGAGQGTHLEMGTDSDSGWSSMYIQRYNFGGGGANDDRMMQFTVNTSARGYIRSTTSGTTYQGSSDYRIKKNIVNLSSTDNIIKQLRPVEFESTSEEGTDFDGLKHVGFLAHEVQEAGVVDCVSGTKDQVDEDGEPVIQGMDYGRLTPYLVKSLQDALTKIDALETRIKTLES